MRFGRYELERTLAVGGMAEVLLARETGGAGRRVVLKRIRPEYSSAPEFQRAFQREIAVAAKLDHPNIVRVIDVGDVGGALFIVMEWVPGKDLRALMAQPLSVAAAATILLDVAAGLAHAHERVAIIHRDVSPSNVWIGNDGIARVIDFGIAKAVAEAAHATKSHARRGKSAYFAPEQVLERALDERTDLFALGVVAFEALAGKHPFRRATEFETMHAITNEAPPPLDSPLAAIVLEALAKDPTERPRVTQWSHAFQETLLSAGIVVSRTEVAKLISVTDTPAPRAETKTQSRTRGALDD